MNLGYSILLLLIGIAIIVICVMTKSAAPTTILTSPTFNKSASNTTTLTDKETVETSPIQKKPKNPPKVYDPEPIIVEKPLTRAPYVIDAFIFFNEIDMLRTRISILAPFVDYFVIVESEMTFSGIRREKTVYSYDLIRDLVSEEKIVYVCIPAIVFAVEDDPWVCETLQRNTIRKGVDLIPDINARDILIVCDVDEIWDPSRLQAIKDEVEKDDVYTVRLGMNFYYYSLHWKVPQILDVSRAGFYKSLSGKTVQEVFRKNHVGSLVTDCGWHCSYFMTAADIAKKIESFSHQEMNLDTYKNAHYILECAKYGKDLYNRDYMKFFYEDTAPDAFKGSVYWFPPTTYNDFIQNFQIN